MLFITKWCQNDKLNIHIVLHLLCWLYQIVDINKRHSWDTFMIMTGYFDKSILIFVKRSEQIGTSFATEIHGISTVRFLYLNVFVRVICHVLTSGQRWRTFFWAIPYHLPFSYIFLSTFRSRVTIQTYF